MNNNTCTAIVCGLLILTIGGCLTNVTYQQELTEREREKTKQLIIQSKIDSLQIASNEKSN